MTRSHKVNIEMAEKEKEEAAEKDHFGNAQM